MNACASAALAALLCSAASAQTVINEVLYDPIGADAGKEIIEIANLGANARSLTGWSLCVGFKPALSRAYWNLPNGTSIAAKGFVRIHWLANGQNSATDLFTGTAASGFSCLLPPMPLDNAVGSVALYRSQGCLAFCLSANIVDFMQWGGSTFREPVAVAAGIWKTGAAIKVFAEGHSTAYDGSGDLVTDYFDDLCPTLGSANTGPGKALSAKFGAGCRGSNGVPRIVTLGGPPALGNQSFALDVQNGRPNAPSVLLVGLTKTSIPVLGCKLLVSPLVTLPWSVGRKLPVPISCNPSQVGASLLFQWAILDPGGPSGLAASDGLELTL